MDAAAVDNLKPEHMNTVIISDFHMCAGTNPSTGMTSRLEDFVNDHVFDVFLDWLEKRHENTCHLIFAGDLFDYQQVIDQPDPAEIRTFDIPIHRDDLKPSLFARYELPDREILRSADFDRAQVTDLSEYWTIETRVEGLGTEEEAVLFKTKKIIDGHPVFFKSLSRFVANGNRVTILRGNHDVELAWESSQKLIRKHCAELAGKETDSFRIDFLPLYYYEKGKVYVEHGQQAEGTTALRHVYAPFMLAHTGGDRLIELDFSSFLVRYLINRVESINPLSDNVRPRSKYFKWLVREHPASSIAIVAIVLPRVRKLWKKFVTPAGLEDAAIRQREEMKRSSEATGLPLKAAEEIEAAKDPPTLPRGKKYVVNVVLKAAGKALFYLVLTLAALSLYLATGKALLPELSSYSVGGYALYLLTRFAFYILPPAILAIIYLNRVGRRKERLRFTRKPVDSGSAPLFRAYVSNIHAVLKKYDAAVPVIVTGHTHYCDSFRIEPDVVYYNTGSWMFVLNPEEQVFREKYTFSFTELTPAGSSLRQFDTATRTDVPVVVEH